jgi:hypothetical protein
MSKLGNQSHYRPISDPISAGTPSEPDKSARSVQHNDLTTAVRQLRHGSFFRGFAVFTGSSTEPPQRRYLPHKAALPTT